MEDMVLSVGEIISRTLDRPFRVSKKLKKNPSPTNITPTANMAAEFSDDMDASEYEDLSTQLSAEHALTEEESLDDLMTLESKFANIHDMSHEDQLELLIHEIKQVIIYNLPLDSGWYTKRMEFIYDYATIGWIEMAERLEGEDPYISTTSREIMTQLRQLMAEWDYRPTISLPVYYRVLHDIQEVWRQYQMKYVGDEDDADVVGLIEQMTYVSFPSRK